MHRVGVGDDWQVQNHRHYASLRGEFSGAVNVMPSFSRDRQFNRPRSRIANVANDRFNIADAFEKGRLCTGKGNVWYL